MELWVNEDDEVKDGLGWERVDLGKQHSWGFKEMVTDQEIIFLGCPARLCIAWQCNVNYFYLIFVIEFDFLKIL